MNIVEAISKLKSYLHFKSNWDQQGAKAPFPDSIHQAIEYILNAKDDPYLVGITQDGCAFVEYIQSNGIDSDNFIFLGNGKCKYSVIERKTQNFREV